MFQKLLKRLFVLFAIVFVTFQPVFLPIAYAVEPWSGDPWEGNPWDGQTWDGSEIEWEDTPWEGNPWDGESWEGDRVESNGPINGNPWLNPGFNGNPYGGDPWLNSGFNGNPYGGDPWSNPGFNGNPYGGNSWSNSGFNGNPYGGNPWLNPGFNGNGYEGNPWLNPDFSGDSYVGTPWATNPYGYGPGVLGYPWAYPGFDGNEIDSGSIEENYPSLPKGYDIAKYVTNDLVGGYSGLIGDYLTHENMTNLGYNSSMNYGGSLYTGLLVNGLKLGVGDHFAFDAYDTATHFKDGVGAAKDFVDARKFNTISNTGQDLLTGADAANDLLNAADNADNFVPPAGAVGAVSKLNVASAAVGTAYSAFETGFNTAKAVDVITSDATGAEKTSAVTDATASLGDTLMSAGAVTAAIPGAQAAGAIMVGAGAGVWLVSKGVKLFADNWKGGPLKTTKHLANKAGNAIKDGWNKVKGWFS